MSETIQVDNLCIEVRRSDRRKTVDLTVDRFGGVVVSVPAALSLSEMKRLIQQKQVWIHRALERKEAALHPRVQREYVTGEGFFYLGKKHRLKIVDSLGEDSGTSSLLLRNGRLLLRRDAVAHGREHFVKWYAARAKEWIPQTVESLRTRVAASPKNVGIRDLGYRWGSCSPSGQVYFHWRVMLLPPHVIHYLILHELVHLHEPHHGPAFYERLRRAVSDYAEIEAWLEASGGLYQL